MKDFPHTTRRSAIAPPSQPAPGEGLASGRREHASAAELRAIDAAIAQMYFYWSER